MSGGVYGGDEVGALVLDIGSYSSRAGYAGEDTPKVDIPTTIGVGPSPVVAMETNKDPVPAPEKKHYIDPTFLYTPREGVEMASPLRDGIGGKLKRILHGCFSGALRDIKLHVDDWDLYQRLLSHIFSRHIKCKPEEHPVLMSEATWNTKQKREKLTELMFETYKVPAFFLCKTAVLSAFANGRSTALVVDSGAVQTSVVPVHDGYALQGAALKTPLAGDFITAKCRSFMRELNVDVVPPYLIASKEAVKEKTVPIWTKKNIPSVTESYHLYMVNEVLRDFAASVGHVSATSLQNEIEQSTSIPTTLYEFPNGYNINLTIEKFKLCEGLFDASTSNLKRVSGGDLLSIPNVVINSAGMCDVDIRPGLYSSVVVVGGNSLLSGFTERLNRELSHRTPPSIRVKLVQNSSTVERRFSSWIGGSILASLGTFQQMWISRQEYEEIGKIVVEKKCP